MHELERSRKNPERKELDLHVVKGIYMFLLTNRFAIQFYYFLKNNKILLKNKRSNLMILDGFLFSQRYLFHAHSDFEFSQFLENFILVWDLFEYPHEEFLQIKKDIKKRSDISNLTSLVRLKQEKEPW